MGTSVLHIKTEIECRVYLFDEYKGIATPGVYFNLEVRIGVQDLLFVSVSDVAECYSKQFNVENFENDYHIIIEKSKFKKLTDIASSAEVNNGIIDKDGVVYSRDGKSLLRCKNEELRQYQVKEGCEIIREYAFAGTLLGCGITSIVLPAGLKHIGDFAFYGCSNLVGINLPNSLLSIGTSAFEDCYYLSQISLPASIRQVGVGAFVNTMVRTITSESKKFYFKDGCLIDRESSQLITYLSDNQNVKLPKGLKSIGNFALYKNKNIKSVILPEGLTHIGKQAFRECRSLSCISLPASLTRIDQFAFIECDNLTAIIIPFGKSNLFGNLLPEKMHSLIKEDIIPYLEKKPKTREERPPLYLFFDTETSGLPKDDSAPASDTRNWPRLVQLAWILTDEVGNVLSSSSSIIKPDGFTISKEATKIHGIDTAKALREGKPLKNVIEEFLNATKKANYLVGHNISFDQKIVGAELCRLGMKDTISTVKGICTMRSATNYCEIPRGNYYGYKPPKLQELYQKLFGCNFDNAHDAMADVKATAKCFFELKRREVVELMIEEGFALLNPSALKKREAVYSLQEMADRYGKVTVHLDTMRREDGSEYYLSGLKFGKGPNSLFVLFSSCLFDDDPSKRDSEFWVVEIGKKVWSNREQYYIVQEKDEETGELLKRKNGDPILMIYPKA